MAKHFPRIDGLTAIEANKVILFRRGPSNYTQLLVWDFNTDERIAGDTIKAKLFSRRSDVTPDGNYLVTFFLGNPRNLPDFPQNIYPTKFEDSFTVLSIPPAFTPEALWLSEDTYGGGGNWRDNKTLIHYPIDERTVMPAPDNIAVLLGEIRYPDFSIFKLKLIARGWLPVPEPLKVPRPPFEMMKVPTYEEALAIGERSYYFNSAAAPTYKSFQKTFPGGEITYHYSWEEKWCTVHSGQRNIELELHTFNHHPLWIDIDNSGRLVYADKGCLYAWRDFPNGKPQLIADLNPNIFENIPPSDWALGP